MKERVLFFLSLTLLNIGITGLIVASRPYTIIRTVEEHRSRFV